MFYRKHKPINKARKDSATYWFLNACRDGCFRCVKSLVEEYGVRKDVRSESAQYDGRDFVFDTAHTWFIIQQEADMILTYLAETP